MGNGLTSDYFELFGIEPRFDIDTAELSRRYRQLQQTVHPDRYANATDQERRLSMQQATRINEAYQTLKDPVARARYLLELAGEDPEGGQGSIQSPEFLMQQMEMREALAEARDQADPLAVVGDILDQVALRIRETTSRLEACFQGTHIDVDAARDLIGKLQFLYKLRSEAEQLEADLEDELL